MIFSSQSRPLVAVATHGLLPKQHRDAWERGEAAVPVDNSSSFRKQCHSAVLKSYNLDCEARSEAVVSRPSRYASFKLDRECDDDDFWPDGRYLLSLSVSPIKTGWRPRRKAFGIDSHPTFSYLSVCLWLSFDECLLVIESIWWEKKAANHSRWPWDNWSLLSFTPQQNSIQQPKTSDIEPNIVFFLRISW